MGFVLLTAQKANIQIVISWTSLLARSAAWTFAVGNALPRLLSFEFIAFAVCSVLMLMGCKLASSCTCVMRSCSPSMTRCRTSFNLT